MAPGVVVCWSGSEPRLQTLRIPGDGLILGREAHASPTDERISRQHARIRIVDEGVVLVEDLQSRNGTFVNRYEEKQPKRAALPVVVRTGATVSMVVRDIEPYEDLHEGKVGAAFDRARAQIEEAARAEQNVTIHAGKINATALLRHYREVFGAEILTYEPALRSSLDTALADARPRVVALDLMECALSFADMPILGVWLETDVRFVTLMWPHSNALSMIDPAIGGRLRERVIVVENPRCDELPVRIRELVRELAPDTRAHPTLCEGMLLGAITYDAEWLVERFARAVAAWHADPALDHRTLRMGDLWYAIEPPPSGAHCLVGDPERRRRSF